MKKTIIALVMGIMTINAASAQTINVYKGNDVVGTFTIGVDADRMEYIPSVHATTDLTADESFANCFIVSKSGDYRFATKHVDGTSVDGVKSADWVWMTKADGISELISDVRFENDSIYFTASEGKGNALIAALSDDGNVMWSWHVWLTDEPGKQQLDNGTVFMDRNLGATSALPEDGAATFGLKYQWGRKDPFYGGDRNETSEDSVFTRANENTVMNPTLGRKWTAFEKTAEKGTVDWTTANPTSFIYTTDRVEQDWKAVRDDYLWNDKDTGKKTNYDPSPAGWRVANTGAWDGVRTDNVFENAEQTGRVHTTEAGEVFWWPLTGSRWGDTDAGRLGYVGQWGTETIWMRSTENCGFNAACFYVMGGTYVSNNYAMYRAHGVSVRCVLDK